MSKKSFDFENPALAIIGKAQKNEPASPISRPSSKAPEGYKVNPMYIETRSKRLQLLIQPSLYEKLKERADREGRSVNDLVHYLLEDALTDDLERDLEGGM